MFEHDLISGEDRLSGFGGSGASNGPDFPDCVVSALVEKTHLLVPGEASESKGRYWL